MNPLLIVGLLLIGAALGYVGGWFRGYADRDRRWK